jgi:hypothetical protein
VGAGKRRNACKHPVPRNEQIRIGLLDNSGLLIRTVALWNADLCGCIPRVRRPVPERQQRFDRERFRCMMGAGEYVGAGHWQKRNLSA